MRKNILKLFETSCSGMERSGMEWKDGRKQHPGGMGEVFPHINNMSDQRIQYYRLLRNIDMNRRKFATDINKYAVAFIAVIETI